MGKADLHIHTTYSPDGTATVAAVLEHVAQTRCVDLLAITDHDVIDVCGPSPWPASVVQHLDAGDVDAYAALFTEDGELKLGPLGKAKGREQIKAVMARSIEGLVPLDRGAKHRKGHEKLGSDRIAPDLLAAVAVERCGAGIRDRGGP